LRRQNGLSKCNPAIFTPIFSRVLNQKNCSNHLNLQQLSRSELGGYDLQKNIFEKIFTTPYFAVRFVEKKKLNCESNEHSRPGILP
jgi:hypothetical protein